MCKTNLLYSLECFIWDFWYLFHIHSMVMKLVSPGLPLIRWNLYRQRCRRWGPPWPGWSPPVLWRITQLVRGSLFPPPHGRRGGGSGGFQISRVFPSQWTASRTGTEQRPILSTLSIYPDWPVVLSYPSSSYLEHSDRGSVGIVAPSEF